MFSQVGRQVYKGMKGKNKNIFKRTEGMKKKKKKRHFKAQHLPLMSNLFLTKFTLDLGVEKEPGWSGENKCPKNGGRKSLWFVIISNRM